MTDTMQIDALIKRSEADLAARFSAFEDNEALWTGRVLSAFQKERVGQRHFSGTNGYGYDDIGRDTLDRVLATVFQAEAALLRPQVASGTQMISDALFSLLRPGERLLSLTGAPYDTLQQVIGHNHAGDSTLNSWGIGYDEVALTEDGKIDTPAVIAALRPNTRACLIQRSRGYALRDALLPRDMKDVIGAIKAQRPDIFILVDNCYGAFVTAEEPTFYGADLVAGSLIKNLGGGLAPTGGYAAGTQVAIDRLAQRQTAPGIGAEVGSYQSGYRLFYQGLFMAPHAVVQALKSACLFARVYELAGFSVSPAFDAPRSDTIQALLLETPDRLLRFCRAVQAESPIDSHLTPEPWAMPGYDDQVVMAAGTFVAGATSELSADAPLRAPYAVYLQGALTYQHARLVARATLEQLMS